MSELAEILVLAVVVQRSGTAIIGSRVDRRGSFVRLTGRHAGGALAQKRQVEGGRALGDLVVVGVGLTPVVRDGAHEETAFVDESLPWQFRREADAVDIASLLATAWPHDGTELGSRHVEANMLSPDFRS